MCAVCVVCIFYENKRIFICTFIHAYKTNGTSNHSFWRTKHSSRNGFIYWKFNVQCVHEYLRNYKTVLCACVAQFKDSNCLWVLSWLHLYIKRHAPIPLSIQHQFVSSEHISHEQYFSVAFFMYHLLIKFTSHSVECVEFKKRSIGKNVNVATRMLFTD